MPSQTSTIAIQVTCADALAFKADVLVLKHAQALYGIDGAAYQRLIAIHPQMRLPEVGGQLLIETQQMLEPSNVLFLGVEPLPEFGYAQIRDFGRCAMSKLCEEKPTSEHVALTIHGPGYGLDEAESFESELAGIIEAINAGDFPRNLTRITFVERDAGRANRLSLVLDRLVPSGYLETGGRGPLRTLASAAQTSLRTAGYGSAAKPRVFVAMSFAPEMDDVFHYGLQGAVNAAGLLAERADLSAFTGDVMDWVKKRISTATLVVADLSSTNPNVYLEVGYAWGRGIPTVLLARSGEELKFDVQGQRCILYSSIKDLEEKLTRELRGLSVARA